VAAVIEYIESVLLTEGYGIQVVFREYGHSSLSTALCLSIILLKRAILIGVLSYLSLP